MRWVNEVEDWGSGATDVELWGVGCLGILIFLLSCSAFVYFGELYRGAPGWGPVVKFDAEAGEEIRIRQHVLLQHKKAQDAQSYGATAKANEQQETVILEGVPIKGQMVIVTSGSLKDKVGVVAEDVNDQGLLQINIGEEKLLFPADTVVGIGFVRHDWAAKRRENAADPCWPRDVHAQRRVEEKGHYLATNAAYAYIPHRMV